MCRLEVIEQMTGRVPPAMQTQQPLSVLRTGDSPLGACSTSPPCLCSSLGSEQSLMKQRHPLLHGTHLVRDALIAAEMAHSVVVMSTDPMSPLFLTLMTAFENTAAQHCMPLITQLLCSVFTHAIVPVSEQRDGCCVAISPSPIF